MSIAAVSGNSQQVSPYLQQRAADFKQLGEDLQSGNLSAAQQDYNTIEALAECGPLTDGEVCALNQRQQDFEAVGQALQNGDLAAAQQAFAQLKAPSNSQALSTYFQQRATDLKQLAEDLQSGNLSAAQQDYNTIETLAQNGPLTDGEAFALNQRQQDFGAVGQALQNGDITGAQQAFAQLAATLDFNWAPSGTGSGTNGSNSVSSVNVSA